MVVFLLAPAQPGLSLVMEALELHVKFVQLFLAINPWDWQTVPRWIGQGRSELYV